MEARHRYWVVSRLCWTEPDEDTAIKMKFEVPMAAHRDRSLFLEPSARLGRWEWNDDRINP